MSAKPQQGKTVQRLLSWLQQREDEMSALLADLVAVPTENPPGRHYLDFAEVLLNRAEKLGLPFERIAASSQDHGIQGDSACLSASYGEGERTFYFHGHYDVVPAQSEEQFKPQRKGHFLFGRGACDMKGGIVSMLYAILALKKCGIETDGKVSLVLVPGTKRREALMVPRGWRSREYWEEMESACSWPSRLAASCGMPTAGRSRFG